MMVFFIFSVVIAKSAKFGNQLLLFDSFGLLLYYIIGDYSYFLRLTLLISARSGIY